MKIISLVSKTDSGKSNNTYLNNVDIFNKFFKTIQNQELQNKKFDM